MNPVAWFEQDFFDYLSTGCATVYRFPEKNRSPLYMTPYSVDTFSDLEVKQFARQVGGDFDDGVWIFSHDEFSRAISVAAAAEREAICKLVGLFPENENMRMLKDIIRSRGKM